MVEELIRAAELKTELDTFRPLSPEAEDRIMQKFRLDWNYNSNHLEGNQLTYGETRALILFGVTAQGKPLKDHIEMTGHNEAIEVIIDVIKEERPLNKTFINELHTLLLKEPYYVDALTPDGQPTKRLIEVGKYKSRPNHVKMVTGEMFYFATPEETPAKMQDLLDWYREKKDAPNTNPIVLAAEFHYRFILIHPFDDGNGRMARLLMNFILMQSGYPPVIVKTDDKENYLNVLRLADAGNLEPFIEYITNNLIQSLKLMIRGAKGENIEEPDDLDKEIALLEQKLKAIGSEHDVYRTNESLLLLFDKSITPLIKEFYLSCQKLDRYYIDKRFWVQTDGGRLYKDIEEAIKFSRDILIENHRAVTEIRYEHDAFNREQFEEFGFSSFIRIGYTQTQYQIFTQKYKLQKSYSHQLMEDEINEIVKSEIKRHLDFIDEQIDKVKLKAT